jgi:hypothetical protein
MNETTFVMLQSLTNELDGIAKEAGVFSEAVEGAGKWIKNLPKSTWESGVRTVTHDIPASYGRWAADKGWNRLAGRAVGTVGGAGIGAGLGAVTTPEDADPNAWKRRALGGAMIGGTLGLGAGQFMSQAGREQAGRFAARQAHGVTGYMPRTQEQIEKGLSRFDVGPHSNWTPEERIKALESVRMHVGQHAALPPDVLSGARGATGWERFSQRANSAHREAAEQGMTSLPGLARGFLYPGEGGSRLRNLGTAVLSPGPKGLAMMGALTAPAVYSAVTAPPEERGSRVGRVIGETAGFTLAGPVGMLPNTLAFMGAGSAGKRIGGLFNSPAPQTAGAPVPPAR